MVDAQILQVSPSTNYGNLASCEVDGDDGSGVDKSCLLRWDVSSIPTDAVVQSATITLLATDGTPNTYNVYALKRTWSESSVTWNRATTSSSWQTAGALGANDRGAVIGTVTGSGTRVITVNAAGIALIQDWVRGGTNAGIIIADASATDGIDFASSEYATVASRPKLTVTYSTGSTGTGGATSTGGASSTGGSATGGTGTGGAVPDPNLLVAFLGDQGNGSNADRVLQLVKSEGAHAVVHNGDFDYVDSPSAWNGRIDSILGTNYPYFAVVGNHDAVAWNGATGYASYINARLARVPEMQCQGDPGVKAVCRFRGLHMVQSCVGTSELTGHGNCSKDSTEQTDFIRTSLANDSSLWSICTWHKNQSDMQIGTKPDEVGWNAYRECMNAGAIISTAHEHSYSRTLALTNLGNGSLGHGAVGTFDSLTVSPGRTFVFVSGLGGNSVRDYDAASHSDDTWWAAQYAANRWLKSGAVQSGTGTYGATFIRFHVDGNPRLARGYFKDVNGRIADEFTIQIP
jgi:hypothetical protein